jgi:hypothetical protein
MTVVAMASLRGAPGTTTAALGLAAVAATRQPALLIEADPAGGVLIGRCASLEGAPTLEQLAFPDRDAATLTFPALLERSMQHLGDLPVAVAPADPFRASASVAGHRSRWVSNVHHLDALVIIDCGRLNLVRRPRPSCGSPICSCWSALPMAATWSLPANGRCHNSSSRVIVRYSAIRRSCSPWVPVGTDRGGWRASSEISTWAHCPTIRVRCRYSFAAAHRRIALCAGSISSALSIPDSMRSSPTPRRFR